MFHNAIGVYRSRIFEAFNPLYWIQAIISLPRLVLGYLDVPAESVVVKVLQLAYWIVGAAAAFLYALYKTEFDAFVKSWIDSLLP